MEGGHRSAGQNWTKRVYHLCYARLAEVSSTDPFKEDLETQVKNNGGHIVKESIDSTDLD